MRLAPSCRHGVFGPSPWPRRPPPRRWTTPRIRPGRSGGGAGRRAAAPGRAERADRPPEGLERGVAGGAWPHRSPRSSTSRAGSIRPRPPATAAAAAVDEATAQVDGGPGARGAGQGPPPGRGGGRLRVLAIRRGERGVAGWRPRPDGQATGARQRAPRPCPRCHQGAVGGQGPGDQPGGATWRRRRRRPSRRRPSNATSSTSSTRARARAAATCSTPPRTGSIVPWPNPTSSPGATPIWPPSSEPASRTWPTDWQGSPSNLAAHPAAAATLRWRPLPRGAARAPKQRRRSRRRGGHRRAGGGCRPGGREPRPRRRPDGGADDGGDAAPGADPGPRSAPPRHNRTPPPPPTAGPGHRRPPAPRTAAPRSPPSTPRGSVASRWPVDRRAGAGPAARPRPPMGWCWRAAAIATSSTRSRSAARSADPPTTTSGTSRRGNAAHRSPGRADRTTRRAWPSTSPAPTATWCAPTTAPRSLAVSERGTLRPLQPAQRALALVDDRRLTRRGLGSAWPLAERARCARRQAFARRDDGLLAVCPDRRASRASEVAPHGQDQGRQSGRRDGRRRDDADHLAVHQGEADPALPRRRPEVLRPRHRAPGRDRRPGDDRRRATPSRSTAWRQVRHDHARRGPRRGVRPQEDVALAQRHDPQHPRRRGLPRADHLLEHPPLRAGLDEADHHRPPRPRRPVQGHRLQGAQARARSR